MITFRLADSLPTDIIATLEEQLRTASNPNSDTAQRQQLQRLLDAGHGACVLRGPQIAELVEQALLFFDGQRYALLAWVIMPNHVYVLIETWSGYPLSAIVQSWKSYTAKAANHLLGHIGQFWYKEYFDRYIRDADHLEAAVRYIHYNPVKAGLAPAPEQWPWSSASYHQNSKA